MTTQTFQFMVPSWYLDGKASKVEPLLVDIIVWVQYMYQENYMCFINEYTYCILHNIYTRLLRRKPKINANRFALTQSVLR